MVLNYIWIGFVLIAIVVAMVAAFVTGSADPLTAVMNATFDSAKTGFEISLGLTGVLSLWLGIMKIGEKGGVVNAMSRLVAPFFCKIFPEVPKNHPAMGSMFMNMSANMLGLDNAATPLGLKAMHELQELNPKKDTATNPMIMFLVLNTSGLVIVPISIMVYRAQLGAANPSDVFLPILLATYFATLAGLIAVSVAQKINLFQKTILLTLLGLTLLIVGVIVLFSQLSKEEIQFYSAFVANFLLLSIIALFLISGIRKKINVYEAFIEGAKEGFKVAVGIIPYLVAILVGIGMFRASGAMDFVVVGIEKVFAWAGFNTDFVGALPTALMKPLSGSGSRGMMIDAMKMYGADSFVGRLSCLVQGSTDTTFYILAVYFGSVGISKMRHAVVCGLIADFVGAFAAICIGYLFFH
ncbi:MAG: nucleoside recognition domain-containing protein [Bacteroidota bacterium]|jgi:spore maturation protein SpmA|nr:nucleoside recognition domain-containing protein [Bacteroidota bacterium]HHT61266.1 spore maturation protein [Bacteroidales bacterium]HOA46320.1 nucleoside recognition domain-containing protein [Paludibacteraceae bacterium]HOG36312.1 nucleoside recognition domain-containing protein [Paludibacteraceae bacterium]HOH70857.1 nucleoside recognition domain-containing protein [Paludibacteraceae bacterium]